MCILPTKKTIIGIYSLAPSHNPTPKVSKQAWNKDLMLLSHLQGLRPLLQQKLACCKVQPPILGDERVSPGRAVTPTHDIVRKRASHIGANEYSYKLFILQNRGIFYGVEHWNHSIMNRVVETL